MKNQQAPFKASLYSKHLVAEVETESDLLNEIFHIQTNIEIKLKETKMPIVLMTSTNPSEGKTFIATNLAAMYAQQGKETLLVDTNLYHPALHTLFALPNNLGLHEVAQQKVALNDAVKPSDIEGLDILTSGMPHASPPALFSGLETRSMLKTMKKKYEMIIFDGPAILVGDDVREMAELADGIVLVVRKQLTTVKETQMALEQIDNNISHVLGTVLNN